jgi:hypothetical protein
MRILRCVLVLISLPVLASGQTNAISKLWGTANGNHGPLLTSSKWRSMDHAQGDVKQGAAAQALTWDAVIGKPGNCVDGGTVTCMVADSTDLYLAGDFRTFDTVTTDFLVHYSDKTGWESLDGGPHNVVHALALHNHKLYVGGSFSTVGKNFTSVNYIAVWDGSWHAMAGGMNDDVNALAFVGDTLYAGGYFSQAGGVTAYGLAFWDGFGWQEAAGGTSYPVHSLYSTHDSLFVGGDFTYVGSETNAGVQANGLALLHKGDWITFGDGFDGTVLSMVMFQGKLWAAGDFYRSRDLSELYYSVVAWDGSQWNTFGHDTTLGTSASGEVMQLLPRGDTLYALGLFNSMAGVTARNFAQYVNGTWSEAGGGVYGVTQAGIVFDNKLWIGGSFTKAGGAPINSIGTLRAGVWSAQGKEVSYLTGLGPHIGWASNRVATIVANSKYVIIGGHFSTIAGKTANHIAAWDKQTKQWTTLGEGVNGDVFALALDGNNLYVGGNFNYAGTVKARKIAKYDLGTATWSAMGDGAMRDVGSIAIDKDKNVYGMIFFTAEGTDFNNYLGKWNGSEWSVFGGPFIGYAEALAWQGNTLFVGGSLRIADGGAVDNIAQLFGGSWSALNGGVNGTIYALCPVGQDLYVAGEFTRVDGELGYGVAKWDGATWDAMLTGLGNAGGYALARSNKGVYIGGSFISAGDVGSTVTVNNLTEWTGTSYKALSGGVNNTINALATDETALYMGGWMEEVGTSGIPSFHFAALKGAGAGVEAADNVVSSISIFPNPISITSTISLSLERSADVRLELFNALGERAAVIVDKKLAVGPQEFKLDPGTLPNGIYFLRLTANGVVSAQAVQIDR